MFSQIIIIVLFACFAILKSEPYTEGKNDENESEVTYNKFVVTWPTSISKGWFKIPDNLKSAISEGWTEIKGGSSTPQIKALGFMGDPRYMVKYSSLTSRIVGYQVSFPKKDVANVPIDYSNHMGITEQTLNGEKYFGGSAYLIENPKGNRQIWVEYNSTKYEYIPNDANLIPLKTRYLKKKCVPTMADPHYYAVNASTDCSNFSPWVMLVRDNKVVGLTFQAIGTATAAKERTWWEVIPASAVRPTIPDAPDCLIDGVTKYGLISVHTWFIEDPWNITCSEENLPVSS